MTALGEGREWAAGVKIIDNVKEMLETDPKREIRPFYFLVECWRLDSIPLGHARRFLGSLGNQAERNVVKYEPDSCHALPELVEV